MPKFNEKLSKNACIIKSCKPAHQKLKEICNKHQELNYFEIHKELVNIEKFLHKFLIYKKMAIKIGMAIKIVTGDPMQKIGKGHTYGLYYNFYYVNCTTASLHAFKRWLNKNGYFKERKIYINHNGKIINIPGGD